mmetsp:Transcript_32353/g.74512  ORF Transcript_32353/g.74512 Transcript_32353/m.74512 type:complete len:355 (-) Transcript_32353:465-1529(-)
MRLKLFYTTSTATMTTTIFFQRAACCSRNKAGDSALTCAVSEGHIGVVKMLLCGKDKGSVACVPPLRDVQFWRRCMDDATQNVDSAREEIRKKVKIVEECVNMMERTIESQKIKREQEAEEAAAALLSALDAEEELSQKKKKQGTQKKKKKNKKKKKSKNKSSETDTSTSLESNSNKLLRNENLTLLQAGQRSTNSDPSIQLNRSLSSSIALPLSSAIAESHTEATKISSTNSSQMTYKCLQNSPFPKHPTFESLNDQFLSKILLSSDAPHQHSRYDAIAVDVSMLLRNAHGMAMLSSSQLEVVEAVLEGQVRACREASAIQRRLLKTLSRKGSDDGEDEYERRLMTTVNDDSG